MALLKSRIARRMNRQCTGVGSAGHERCSVPLPVELYRPELYVVSSLRSYASIGSTSSSLLFCKKVASLLSLGVDIA